MLCNSENGYLGGFWGVHASWLIVEGHLFGVFIISENHWRLLFSLVPSRTIMFKESMFTQVIVVFYTSLKTLLSCWYLRACLRAHLCASVRSYLRACRRLNLLNRLILHDVLTEAHHARLERSRIYTSLCLWSNYFLCSIWRTFYFWQAWLWKAAVLHKFNRRWFRSFLALVSKNHPIVIILSRPWKHTQKFAYSLVDIVIIVLLLNVCVVVLRRTVFFIILNWLLSQQRWPELALSTSNTIWVRCVVVFLILVVLKGIVAIVAVFSGKFIGQTAQPIWTAVSWLRLLLVTNVLLI